MPAPRKLTVKQEAWYREYLNTGNGHEAYRRCYSAANMAPGTINKEVQRLLNHPVISPRLLERERALRKSAEDRYQITQERILRELALIGLSNMLDYVQPQEDGSAYVDLSKLTRDQAAAINEVTVESYVEKDGETERQVKKIKFKLSDKRAALVDLGKHLNLFPTQVIGKLEHDHKHNHTIEPLSDSARWLEGILGRGQNLASKEPVLH